MSPTAPRSNRGALLRTSPKYLQLARAQSSGDPVSAKITSARRALFPHHRRGPGQFFHKPAQQRRRSRAWTTICVTRTPKASKANSRALAMIERPAARTQPDRRASSSPTRCASRTSSRASNRTGATIVMNRNDHNDGRNDNRNDNRVTPQQQPAIQATATSIACRRSSPTGSSSRTTAWLATSAMAA